MGNNLSTNNDVKQLPEQTYPLKQVRKHKSKWDHYFQHCNYAW